MFTLFTVQVKISVVIVFLKIEILNSAHTVMDNLSLIGHDFYMLHIIKQVCFCNVLMFGVYRCKI
jgi:hypothetical protein